MSFPAIVDIGYRQRQQHCTLSHFQYHIGGANEMVVSDRSGVITVRSWYSGIPGTIYHQMVELGCHRGIGYRPGTPPQFLFGLFSYLPLDPLCPFVATD